MTKRSTENPWLVFFEPRAEAALRLFCLPYAGGSANIFRHWAKRLPAETEVCGVQLPGRGGRLMEPPYTRLEPLIQILARELLPYFDKPFAVFGHSLGALLIFELVHHLRREYQIEPCRMFVSGRRPPQIPDDAPSHQLPESEFLADLRRLNGTPKEILEHSELMDLMLPVIRADFAINEKYQYSARPPFTFPLTVFGGTEDENVGRDLLVAWSVHTTEELTLHMIPGDHFFIDSQQRLLLDLISRELQMAISSIS